MQPRMVLALLGAGLLAAQATTAFLCPDVRTENRNILIQMASNPVYDPTLLTQVTTGQAGHLSTATVTQQQAIETHLDFLDKYGIRLADLGNLPVSSAGAAEPAWPQNGTFKFFEKGYLSAGAQCPPVTPLQPENGQVTAGVLTSDVSRHSYVSSTKYKTSLLWRWNLTDDTNAPAAPTTPVANEWKYGGATNGGWALRATGAIDYLCRADSTLVYHESVVRPLMDRTA